MANNNDNFNLSLISQEKWSLLFSINDADTLMNELKDPNLLIGFFQLACEDKNWKATKPDLLTRVVKHIAKLADEGRFSLATTQKICQTAQNHLPDSILNQDVTISFKDHSTEALSIKSLMLKTIPFYSIMLKPGFKESFTLTISEDIQNQKFVQFMVQSLKGEKELSLQTLKEIENDLKNEDGHSIEDLTDLFSRSICEWQNPTLTKLVFSELKRRDLFYAIVQAFDNQDEESINDGLREFSKCCEDKVKFTFQRPNEITIHLGNLLNEVQYLGSIQNILEFFVQKKFLLELVIYRCTSAHNEVKWGNLFRAVGAHNAAKSFIIQDLDSFEELPVFLRDFPNIEILKFLLFYAYNTPNCSQGYGDEVLEIASQLGENLKEIYCRNDRLSTSAGLAHLINTCPNLQIINLSALKIDNYTLVELKKCQDLKRLDLSTQEYLNPDDILDLLRNCSKLEELYLSNRKELTSEQLKMLFDLCPNVKKLHIENCPNVNNEVLSILAEKCPDLEHLQISQSNNITNFGVSQLLNKCIKLKLLFLELCSKIKIEDLQHLKREVLFIGDPYDYYMAKLKKE